MLKTQTQETPSPTGNPHMQYIIAWRFTSSYEMDKSKEVPHRRGFLFLSGATEQDVEVQCKRNTFLGSIE